MFTCQREKRADSDIIAPVELDMKKKMRVRIVLAPEAIRERLRGLEHPMDCHGERQCIGAHRISAVGLTK
jgi:hypothetical protein